MALEILDGAFVPFGGSARGKGAEIAALPGLPIFLARIEPVFAGFELADHGIETAAGRARFRAGREPSSSSCRLIGMKPLFFALVISALAWPSVAAACDGPAGKSVAVTSDGEKFTVTNVGREALNVVFSAYDNTYTLTLQPGQSDTPRTSGMFTQPMRGYQSCSATAIRYR